MKKITKLSITALAAAAIIGTTILTVPHTSAAVVEPVITTVSVDGEPVITPFTTQVVIGNEPLAGTTSTHKFNIPKGFGYVKLSFKNLGSKQFTFTVNQWSIDGTKKMSGTVPADGKEHTFFGETPWTTGWFFVNVSSGQGMSGKLGARLGTDLSELKKM